MIEILILKVCIRLEQISCNVDGKLGILETADDHSVDKPDPILALIQAHPENVTAPDAKEPLSPKELQGTFIPDVNYCQLTSTMQTWACKPLKSLQTRQSP